MRGGGGDGRWLHEGMEDETPAVRPRGILEEAEVAAAASVRVLKELDAGSFSAVVDGRWERRSRGGEDAQEVAGGSRERSKPWVVTRGHGCRRSGGRGEAWRERGK